MASVLAFLTANVWRTVAVAMAAFALVFLLQAKSARSERDKAREEVGALATQLNVSNTSIATLQNEIEQLMNEAKAREAALERSRKLAEQEAKRFDHARAESAKRIERLLAIPEGGCEVPQELLDEVRGL